MGDERRPMTAACMEITGLGLSMANTEADLLHVWRSYVMYWQGLQTREQLLDFLRGLVAEVCLIQDELKLQQNADAGSMAELFKIQQNVLQVVIVETEQRSLAVASGTFFCQCLGGTFNVMQLLLCALKQRREAETGAAAEHFNVKFQEVTENMMQTIKFYSHERHAFELLQQQQADRMRAALQKENQRLRSELESVRKRKDQLEAWQKKVFKDVADMAEQDEQGHAAWGSSGAV
jgi:hypothetical protein